MRVVKCCASCEYRDDTTLVDKTIIQCSAYVTRRPKIYEICETFYPDVDIWGYWELETKEANYDHRND